MRWVSHALYRWFIVAVLVGLALGRLGDGTAWALDQDLEAWIPIVLELPVSQRISTRLELLPRWNDHLNNFQLFQLQPSIGMVSYQGKTWQTAWRAGYMWARYFEESFDEHRPWGQILISKKLSGLNRATVYYRQRDELRFFEAAGQGSPSLRSRNLVGIRIPLTKTTQAVVYDEVMINVLRNRISPTTFAQNRVYAGLRKEFSKQFSTEIGYILSFLNRASPQEDSLNHGLMLQVVVRP